MLRSEGGGGEGGLPAFEMAAAALKRGAEADVEGVEDGGHARYCREISRFEFGVMLLRNQVEP